MTGPIVRTSTEGKRRCGSCLQWVGTWLDEERPYRTWVGEDMVERTFCADSAACARRWDRAEEARREDAPEGDEDDDR